MTDAAANLPDPWLSKRYTRWRMKEPMTTARQKELIEEYVDALGSLPGGTSTARTRATIAVKYSLQRDNRVRLALSATIPQLTGVFLQPNVRVKPRSLLLNYRGWVLTEAEYERFGYAVHTAVYFPGVFAGGTKYVLVGDPTTPAPQINCVQGTSKQPNVQLVVRKGAVVAGSGSGIADSSITVRATKKIKPGEELWLDYGCNYWSHMSLYCPHCLEYGADATDQMLICESPGCKRAWHQLCLQPCMVEVPDGKFYCDIHN